MKSSILSLLLLVNSIPSSQETPPFLTSDLFQLMKTMDLPHDGSPRSILESTQKRWIRPEGKERWEVEDTLTKIQRTAVLEFCNKQSFFSERLPTHKTYDYAIVLGGSISRMEKRLAYLVKLVHLGYQFKEVVLLSRERVLDIACESIPPGCTTEAQAMEYLWKSLALSTQYPWHHFAHPMIQTGQGQAKRPKMVNTVQLWLQAKPKQGRCLFISNQPYCHYQHAVAETILPKGFIVETAGPKADPTSQNGVVLLDTIAAWLFYKVQQP